MSITTGGGDGGETGLLGGDRVPKDDARIEAYGAVDELNAALALARELSETPATVAAELDRIIPRLFELGADLATPRAARDGAERRIAASAIAGVEASIRHWEGELPALRSFILPGGSAPAAALHLARTVCRRAERRVVQLHREQGDERLALVYLNRLSDLLFLFARAVNAELGRDEVEWKAP